MKRPDQPPVQFKDQTRDYHDSSLPPPSGSVPVVQAVRVSTSQIVPAHALIEQDRRIRQLEQQLAALHGGGGGGGERELPEPPPEPVDLENAGEWLSPEQQRLLDLEQQWQALSGGGGRGLATAGVGERDTTDYGTLEDSRGGTRGTPVMTGDDEEDEGEEAGTKKKSTRQNRTQNSAGDGGDGEVPAVAASHTNSNSPYSKLGLVLYAAAGVVFLLGIGAIAGICGSGQCSSSSSSSSASSSSPTVPTAVPPSAPPPSIGGGDGTGANPTTARPTTVITVPIGPSTSSPTFSPIAAVAPPSLPPVRAQFILGYLSNATLLAETTTTTNDNLPSWWNSNRYPVDNSTAEGRAVQWLIDEEPFELPTDTRSLLQRYVLATLWFLPPPVTTTTTTSSMTNDAADDNPYRATWATNTNVCQWLNVACDSDDRVTRLNLANATFLNSARIPADVGLLTDLTEVYLLFANLTGTIPPTLGRLTALRELELSLNQLTGTVPASLGDLTALTGLELNHNRLTGTIPASIAQLTVLTRWDMEHNQLTGSIPSALTALTALSRLWLSTNGLSGSMPFCNIDQTFADLVADCNEVSCPCCTHCCPTDGWDGIPGFEDC